MQSKWQEAMNLVEAGSVVLDRAASGLIDTTGGDVAVVVEGSVSAGAPVGSRCVDFLRCWTSWISNMCGPASSSSKSQPLWQGWCRQRSSRA